MNMNNTKETFLATEITDALNSSIFRTQEFCEAMSRQHRFLQYEFTNLCIGWLEKAAKMYEDGNYDARNEYACKTAKELIDYLYGGKF